MNKMTVQTSAPGCHSRSEEFIVTSQSSSSAMLFASYFGDQVPITSFDSLKKSFTLLSPTILNTDGHNSGYSLADSTLITTDETIHRSLALFQSEHEIIYAFTTTA